MPRYNLNVNGRAQTVEADADTPLREADAEARDPYEREHVTPFLWRRPERFPALYVDHQPDRRHWRLVVDTAEDYAMAVAVYDALHADDPLFGLETLEKFFAARPDILAMNAHVAQKPYEGRAGA